MTEESIARCSLMAVRKPCSSRLTVKERSKAFVAKDRNGPRRT
jgi:hypothetical protein